MLNDRFWNKVNKSGPNGCWEWTGGGNNKGYGQVSARYLGFKNHQLAHRLSYLHHFGSIPKGGLILHSCDNPRCVNPAHLRVGSFKENVADMDQRGRRVCSKSAGEQIGTSIRTEAEIIGIRRAYVRGDDISLICRTYKVTEGALADYTGGRSWKHLLGRHGCPTLEQLKIENKRRRRNAAILTADKVSQIRRRLAAGEYGKDLAAEYGVHKATISDIKLRKIWSEVP